MPLRIGSKSSVKLDDQEAYYDSRGNEREIASMNIKYLVSAEKKIKEGRNRKYPKNGKMHQRLLDELRRRNPSKEAIDDDDFFYVGSEKK